VVLLSAVKKWDVDIIFLVLEVALIDVLVFCLVFVFQTHTKHSLTMSLREDITI
jgi:hypothetical protein